MPPKNHQLDMDTKGEGSNTKHNTIQYNTIQYTIHVAPEVTVQYPAGFPRLPGPFACQSDPLPVLEL